MFEYLHRKRTVFVNLFFIFSSENSSLQVIRKCDDNVSVPVNVFIRCIKYSLELLACACVF